MRSGRLDPGFPSQPRRGAARRRQRPGPQGRNALLVRAAGPGRQAFPRTGRGPGEQPVQPDHGTEGTARPAQVRRLWQLAGSRRTSGSQEHAPCSERCGGDLRQRSFSSQADSVEADTRFCPERHGPCFGAFGRKTAPAIGNRSARSKRSRCRSGARPFRASRRNRSSTRCRFACGSSATRARSSQCRGEPAALRPAGRPSGRGAGAARRGSWSPRSARHPDR